MVVAQWRRGRTGTWPIGRGGGAGTMLIGAGQEAPAPAPATPQQRVAAPWPHGGGEDVGGGMLGAVFSFWPLQGGDLEGEMNF